MHFLAGVVVAVVCGLAPWAAARLQTKWLAVAAVPSLIVVVAGAAFALPLYPYSDFFVAAFGLSAGVALGRVMPARFRPFLVLLLVLSVLDVGQNVVLSGPSTSSPDQHLVWLNVRFPLADGHFNIGFADVILIAAASENLRRRGVSMGLSLLPGVIGISLGEALLATLPPAPPAYVTAIAASLIPLLAAGYLLTELAASQQSARAERPLR